MIIEFKDRGFQCPYCKSLRFEAHETSHIKRAYSPKFELDYRLDDAGRFILCRQVNNPSFSTTGTASTKIACYCCGKIFNSWKSAHNKGALVPNKDIIATKDIPVDYELHGNVYLIGSTHGDFEFHVPEDADHLIMLGDTTLGQPGIVAALHKLSKCVNYKIWCIRGNRDFPEFWIDPVYTQKCNFTCIRDNSLLRINNQLYFATGGATSLDSLKRKAGYDWFLGEDMKVVLPQYFGRISGIFSHIGTFSGKPDNKAIASWMLKDLSLAQRMDAQEKELNKLKNVRNINWYFCQSRAALRVYDTDSGQERYGIAPKQIIKLQ